MLSEFVSSYAAQIRQLVPGVSILPGVTQSAARESAPVVPDYNCVYYAVDGMDFTIVKTDGYGTLTPETIVPSFKVRHCHAVLAQVDFTGGREQAVLFHNMPRAFLLSGPDIFLPAYTSSPVAKFLDNMAGVGGGVISKAVFLEGSQAIQEEIDDTVRLLMDHNPQMIIRHEPVPFDRFDIQANRYDTTIWETETQNGLSLFL